MNTDYEVTYILRPQFEEAEVTERDRVGRAVHAAEVPRVGLVVRRADRPEVGVVDRLAGRDRRQ